MSRRGPEDAGARELRAQLSTAGVEVEVVACDVTDRAQLVELLERIPSDRPLTGIVHAAGVLEDGLIGSLTSEQIERVLAPKLAAAWYLDELSAEMPVAAFVMFSSAVATLGSAGQASYAAANAFMDALAVHRRARGRAGISVAWGLWAEASGMTGALGGADLARLGRLGIAALATEEGLELLDRAVALDEPLVVAARLDRGALRARAQAGDLPVLLRGIVPLSAWRPGGAAGSLALRLASVGAAERRTLIRDVVLGEIAAVLGFADPARFNSELSFKSLGFDSLAAVELRNRLNAICGVRLAPTAIFDYPSADRLTEALLAEVAPAETGGRMEAELAGLEGGVSMLSADGDERRRVAKRLRALIARLEGAAESENGAGADSEPELTTDQEMFEFIDRDMGAL